MSAPSEADNFLSVYDIDINENHVAVFPQRDSVKGISFSL